MLLIIVVVAVLILLTSLYVAAEFAAVSARRRRIEQLAAQGDRNAAQLFPILSDPEQLDRYIAASQVGITISSLILGAYGQATIAERLVPLFENLGAMQRATAESVAAGAVLVGLTALHMVFGELIPKSIALQWSTNVALLTAHPMRWSLRLLSWFINALNGSGQAVLRLFGMKNHGLRHVHSPDELAFLVSESTKGGLIDPEAARRLRQALELGEKVARDLMVPRTSIHALDVDTSFEEVVEAVGRSPYTRLPVYEESIDNVIGIVHSRDVVLMSLRSEHRSLRDVLRPVIVAPESITADALLRRFRDERRTLAILVDEFGGTAGLITLDNVLDELIGDLSDDSRTVQPRPERLEDGSIRLPGLLRVHEAAELLNAEWETEASTVSGLVLDTLGRMPLEGETLDIDGVRIVVESVTPRIIRTLIAHPRLLQSDGARDTEGG